MAAAVPLRDTFSVRAHGIVKDDTLIAAAMGHTVEVHHRSYRTTEWRSIRAAFAPASQSKRLNRCSQQQMQQQQYPANCYDRQIMRERW